MLSKNNVIPSLYARILEAKSQGEKLLAILLDPDKVDLSAMDSLTSRINASPATHLFIGGSSMHTDHLDELIGLLKIKVELPVVLFPGHPSQVSRHADALLYLSLLSGRNPDFLIGHHVDSAFAVRASGLELIPTGYILCGDDAATAVCRVSHTAPIPFGESETIRATALAAEMQGKKLVYLEAGSGAAEAVPPGVIRDVSQTLGIPLLVGGGIRSKAGIKAAFASGADLVVIGTAFENDPDFFGDA